MKKKVLVGMCGLFLMGCGAETNEEVFVPDSAKQTAENLAVSLGLDPKKITTRKNEHLNSTIYILDDGSEVIEKGNGNDDVLFIHLPGDTEDEIYDTIEKFDLPAKKEFERYADKINEQSEGATFIKEPKEISLDGRDYKIILNCYGSNYSISLKY